MAEANVYIYNVYLQPDKKKRILKDLQTIVQEKWITDHKGHHLIIGDFNIGLDSLQMEATLPDIHQLGLRVHSQEDKATFQRGEASTKLDYCISTLADITDITQVLDNYHLSDHKPILVRLPVTKLR